MRRHHLNSSKSGVSIDRDRKPNRLKQERSMTIVGHKSNPLKMEKLNRLMGGADEPIEEIQETRTSPVPEEPNPSQEKMEMEKKITPSSNDPCISDDTRSTGDKRVDEIIDYVHQNLQQAGKALATLGENFEHDLKVESRMQLVIVDIMGRIHQWSGIVQNKLDACKNDIENIRKDLIARACTINAKEQEISELKTQLADLKAQFEQCKTRLAQSEKMMSQKPTDLKAIEAALNSEIQAQKKKEEESPSETAISQTLAIAQESVSKSQIQQREKIQDDVHFADTAVQSEKDEEKLKREAELAAEMSRLRKENERIVKERAEYENAIQRALLRGVSSLNVEALKVLRCPPIPCCSPRVPCPEFPTTPTEPILLPCGMKNAKDSLVNGTHKKCSVIQRNGNGKNGNECEQNQHVKQPCASPCCPGTKGRKTASNSMVFLLHQGDVENLCSRNETVIPPVCGTPIMRKIEIPPCPRFSRR